MFGLQVGGVPRYGGYQDMRDPLVWELPGMLGSQVFEVHSYEGCPGMRGPSDIFQATQGVYSGPTRTWWTCRCSFRLSFKSRSVSVSKLLKKINSFSFAVLLAYRFGRVDPRTVLLTKAKIRLNSPMGMWNFCYHYFFMSKPDNQYSLLVIGFPSPPGFDN